MIIDDGVDLAVRTAIAAARPDPELHVDQWSEEFMVLPKSAPHPGPFRFERTPYARRIAQVLSPGHPCKRVVAKVASQMFKTQTAINWIGACIHRAPANILALQPTDGLAKRFSARISQAIRNVRVLRECVSGEKSRDKRNTTQAKDFKGDATLYINTAGAAANLAEITVRYLFIDEVDRLPPLIEGDSVAIAEARATQHERDCKFYEVSSPTIKGISRIDELFEMGTKEVYLVPCPHCGHHHELLLENFHYERDPDTGYMDKAWFVCPENGCIIEERFKSQMFADAEMGGTAHWHATSPGDGETISITMSAFYMPIGAIGWLSLAREHARAKKALERGDHTLMLAFMNTRMGLSYDNSLSATTVEQLQARAEKYPPRVMPDPALVLTAAVDKQDDRLEVQLEAFGPGLERWLIDHIVIPGRTSVPHDQPGSVWEKLDEIRRTPIVHVSGALIYMSAYAVDSGDDSQTVYNYGMPRKGLACHITRGATRPKRPIISSTPTLQEVDWNGEKIPNGAELWTIGTDTAKEWIFSRIDLTDGPGALHFHDQLPMEWFEQLLSERKVLSYRGGHAVTKWVKPNGARNEVLDLSVYNLAMAHRLELHKWSAQDWARLRAKLIPKHLTPDLFAAPPPPQAQTASLEKTLQEALASMPAEPPAESPNVCTDAAPVPAPIPVPMPLQPDPAPPARRRVYSRGI